jgi:flagellar assembly protein FliH
MAAVQAELQPTLSALSAAVGELGALRAQVIGELESDAVALALRVAEHVVAGAIDAEPERIVDIAGLALRRITDRRHVTLVVNPADLELLSESMAGLLSELGGIEQCNVQSDRRVARGGVVARTDAGEVDASIETQLTRVREIVAAELSGQDDDDE